jgi:hypothetical protein
MVDVEEEAEADGEVDAKGETVGKAAKAAGPPNDDVANGEADATPEAAAPPLNGAVDTPKLPKFCANAVVA